jgi:hypothetical protein
MDTNSVMGHIVSRYHMIGHIPAKIMVSIIIVEALSALAKDLIMDPIQSYTSERFRFSPPSP